MNNESNTDNISKIHPIMRLSREKKIRTFFNAYEIMRHFSNGENIQKHVTYSVCA